MAEATSRAIEAALPEPGTYRVEVWLKVGGEDRIWVLSKPVYVRAAGNG